MMATFSCKTDEEHVVKGHFPRQELPGIERKDRKGWVDGHAEPATKDVATNFLARRNSDLKPSQDLPDFENPCLINGLHVNKLARDFRLQKFVEATKLPYEKLEAMTVLEACDTLEAAARDDGFSLIETYTLEDKAIFYVNHIQRHIVDLEDPIGCRLECCDFPLFAV